jgi:hypothetical protein
MIPLARWLETDSPVEPAFLIPQSVSAVEDGGEVFANTDSDLAPPSLTDPRDEYIAQLEESLRLSQEEAERIRAEAIQSERELIERLGVVSAESIADNILAVMSGMKSDLEVALADALTPFISEQVRENAIGQLLGLVEAALSEAGSLELDIHAPLDLHGSLGDSLTRRNITARFHDSAHISITCGSLRSRFEELSGQWLDEIKGRNG